MSIKIFLSVNWIYHTDEEYFLLKFFENNHKCVLWIVYYKHKFIISINFFLSLAVFRFILNKLPFKWYKVPTMLLEKVSIYTQKFYLFIVTSFFLLLFVLFLCFVENCTLLPKGIPYLGLHNVQDFAQILYFAGVVHIINKNNVFHSFFRPENHMSAIFIFFYCLSKSSVSYLYYLDIPQK